MQKASLFNPIDDSLEMRIQAVRDVQQSLHNIEASLEHSLSKGFNSVFGTKEELEVALTLSQDSYKQAIISLSHTELEQAKIEELISPDEFKKITLSKNQEKLSKIRELQNQDSMDRGL